MGMLLGRLFEALELLFPFLGALFLLVVVLAIAWGPVTRWARRERLRRMMEDSDVILRTIDEMKAAELKKEKP